MIGGFRADGKYTQYGHSTVITSTHRPVTQCAYIVHKMSGSYSVLILITTQFYGKN